MTLDTDSYFAVYEAAGMQPTADRMQSLTDLDWEPARRSRIVTLTMAPITRGGVEFLGDLSWPIEQSVSLPVLIGFTDEGGMLCYQFANHGMCPGDLYTFTELAWRVR